MLVVLLQFPVSSEEKKLELDELLHSPDGLAFTKKQKGFISVEYGWADDKNGYKIVTREVIQNDEEDLLTTILENRDNTKTSLSNLLENIFLFFYFFFFFISSWYSLLAICIFHSLIGGTEHNRHLE